jgi:hypothetical protein
MPRVAEHWSESDHRGLSPSTRLQLPSGHQLGSVAPERLQIVLLRPIQYVGEPPLQPKERFASGNLGIEIFERDAAGSHKPLGNRSIPQRESMRVDHLQFVSEEPWRQWGHHGFSITASASQLQPARHCLQPFHQTSLARFTVAPPAIHGEVFIGRGHHDEFEIRRGVAK